ncbi:MAG TPA: MmcQ/YjbR family DNA-binding protein [Candidatus Methylomirabilis sp.]|nr:MmcQ/YjbR family DNA-binding protein [Candidatus Methylomirabilis sp.]
MTPNEFRKLALGLPQTEERAHMNHPDFRVAGKIFATLAYPNKQWAMVKVTPVEQELLMRSEPKVFSPVTGKWGLRGCTSVNLKEAKKRSLQGAIAAAWRLAAPAELGQETGVGSAAASLQRLPEKVAKPGPPKTSHPARSKSSLRKPR